MDTQLIHIKNNKVSDEILDKIEKDVIILNMLFKELNYYIEEQGNQFNSIENYIDESKKNIEVSKNDIIIANNYNNTNIYNNTIIGITLGSILYIYNPHIAICAIISSGFYGWYYNK